MSSAYASTHSSLGLSAPDGASGITEVHNDGDHERPPDNNVHQDPPIDLEVPYEVQANQPDPPDDSSMYSFYTENFHLADHTSHSSSRRINSDRSNETPPLRQPSQEEDHIGYRRSQYSSIASSDQSHSHRSRATSHNSRIPSGSQSSRQRSHHPSSSSGRIRQTTVTVPTHT